VRCHLHNTGATLAGNTQSSDIEWFARWLYGASNFGGGWTETFHWSLNNAEFEKLGLIPDRPWTGYRWETLPPKRKAAWMKLSRLCLYALPHICERIGHRFMEQAQGLRDSQEWPNDPSSPTAADSAAGTHGEHPNASDAGTQSGAAVRCSALLNEAAARRGTG
jgi:hypothetical protein